MIEFKPNITINSNKNILKNNLRQVSFSGHSNEYDSFSAYLKDIRKYSGINRKEERKLAENIKKGGKKAEKAREKLMLSNLRLVIDRVKKRKNNRLPLMDLIQEGNRGLYRATEDYNGEYAFSTYASNWIDSFMRRAEHTQSRIIRLPDGVELKIEAMKRIADTLFNELCRKPTIGEISQKMNLRAEEIKDLIKVSCRVSSLDKTIGTQDDEDTFYKFIQDETIQSPSVYTDKKILEKEVVKMLKCLSPSQREVVIMNFGLFGNTPMTTIAIAEKLNISHQAVNIRIKNALQRLRIKTSHLKKEFEVG